MLSLRHVWLLAVLLSLLAPARVIAELTFSPARLDLGDVPSGALLIHEVKLLNQASVDALKIQFKGSCACLRGGIANGWNEIVAGRQAAVDLRINTLTSPSGRQHWRLTVNYELRGRPHVAHLDVLANVIPEILVQPPQLLVSSEGPTRHEFLLVDLRPRTFQIRKIETSNPHLQARLAGVKLDEQGREARVIEVSVGGQLPVGRYDEQLTIHTDDPVHRLLKVELNLVRRAKQRIAVLPTTIDVVVSEDEPVARRLVSLRDQRGETVEIDVVETDDEAITCTWRTLGNGQAVALTITVDREKVRSESLAGQVRVFLKRPSLEKIVIPVVAQRR